MDIYPTRRCLTFSWTLPNVSTLARRHISRVMLQAPHKERAGSVRRLTCMRNVHQEQEARGHSRPLGWKFAVASRDYRKAIIRMEVCHVIRAANTVWGQKFWLVGQPWDPLGRAESSDLCLLRCQWSLLC